MAKGRGMGLSLIWLKRFEKPPEADKTGEFGVVGIQDLFEGKTPFGMIICPGEELNLTSFPLSFFQNPRACGASSRAFAGPAC